MIDLNFLTFAGSSMQRVCVECWKVLYDNCFHGNKNVEVDGQTVKDISTDLSIEEVTYTVKPVLKATSE